MSFTTATGTSRGWTVVTAIPMILVGLAALLVGAPSQASAAPPASGTYVSTAAAMRLCTNTGNAGCRPAGMPSVARHAKVKMVCWQDGSTATGEYKTNRWFWVDAPTGSGYVHASYVKRQTSVPACSTKRAWVAAEQAVARYGQVMASAADQAMFSNTAWNPGPKGEWAGDCPKLPYVGWRKAGITVPASHARNNYNTWRNQGKIRQGVPPRGAIVFWDVTSYGHTAVSLGNGYVVTTRGMDFDRLPNAVVKYNSYSRYLGWALPA